MECHDVLISILGRLQFSGKTVDTCVLCLWAETMLENNVGEKLTIPATPRGRLGTQSGRFGLHTPSPSAPFKIALFSCQNNL